MGHPWDGSLRGFRLGGIKKESGPVAVGRGEGRGNAWGRNENSASLGGGKRSRGGDSGQAAGGEAAVSRGEVWASGPRSALRLPRWMPSGHFQTAVWLPRSLFLPSPRPPRR